MKRLILLTIAVTLLLAGCKQAELEADLKETKADLAEAQQNLASAKSQVEACETGTKAQEKVLCDKLEDLAHAQLPKSFQVSEDSFVEVPCASEIKVKAYKVDAQRGWAYLRYEMDGDTRFSDRLLFADKPDRNSVNIRHGSIYGAVLLSVSVCEGEECQITCRHLSNTHDPTCQ